MTGESPGHKGLGGGCDGLEGLEGPPDHARIGLEKSVAERLPNAVDHRQEVPECEPRGAMDDFS